MAKYSLRDDLDAFLAFLGLILTSVLTIWLVLSIGNSILISFGFLSFLACAYYITIRKHLGFARLSLDAFTSSRFHWVLNILFLFFFGCSIVFFQLRHNFYRPLGYFIAVTIMASIVSVEILLFASRKGCVYLVLLKNVLIGASIQFSQLLIFPSLVGMDPWFHMMVTSEMLNVGYVPEGQVYSKLPLMHIMVGSTSLVTGTDYKMAAMLSVSLIVILCNVLFTYLLGNFILTKEVGLLGGLLLSGADYNVSMGNYAIPNTMASVFVLAIIYLLLKVKKEKPLVGVFLGMLLMSTLILTHTLVSAWLAMLLFLFWSSSKIRYWIYRTRYKELVTLSIFVLFSVGMLSWWTYASRHILDLGEMIKWGFSIDYFLGYAPLETIRYVRSVPFSEQLFNAMGEQIFHAISLIGCLYMMSKRFGNSNSFVMAIGGLVTLALPFFAFLTGRYILVDRWWYFSQILLALPVSLALFLLCWPVRKMYRSILLAALVFLLSFLMVLSPVANIDNSIFSPNTQIRYAFTEPELRAIEVTSRIWRNIIVTDKYYTLLRYSSYLMEDIGDIYNRDFSKHYNALILIREEIVRRPFKVGLYTYKLDFDPRETITAQGFHRIYDCGNVTGFVYRSSK